MRSSSPLLGGIQGGAAPASFSCAWVLCTFCLLSMLQALTWNFFAPISTTMLSVYGFSNSNIARLANTANIGILVALPPSSVAVDRFGARVPTVACACAMVACTLLRLLPPLVTLGDGAILWLNVASIAFNGAAAA